MFVPPVLGSAKPPRPRANKESIYRYFGTKDELLRRVLDRFLDERGEQLLPQSQDIDAVSGHR